MTATLLPQARRRQPRQAARWAREAAKHVGYQPMTCEKRVQLGIHQEVGEYVRAARLFGAPEIAVKLAQPTLDALDAGEILPLSDAIRQAQKADAEEEIAESRFLLDRSPENRKAFIEATRKQIHASAELLRALEAEV